MEGIGGLVYRNLLDFKGTHPTSNTVCNLLCYSREIKVHAGTRDYTKEVLKREKTGQQTEGKSMESDIKHLKIIYWSFKSFNGISLWKDNLKVWKLVLPKEYDDQEVWAYIYIYVYLRERQV